MCWWQAFICAGLSKLQLLNQGTAVRIFTFPSSAYLPPLLHPGTSWFIFVVCVWERVVLPSKYQWQGPQLYKLQCTCPQPKCSHQTTSGSLHSMCSFRFPWPRSLWESNSFSVHVKLCGIELKSKRTQTWRDDQKHAADVRRLGSSLRL